MMEEERMFTHETSGHKQVSTVLARFATWPADGANRLPDPKCKPDLDDKLSTAFKD